MSNDEVTAGPTVVPAHGTETQPEGLPVANAEQTPHRRWLRRTFFSLFGVFLVGLVIYVVTWRSDQYVLRPGTVTDTTDLVDVQGGDAFDPEGEIALTTVLITREVRAFDYIQARYLDDDADLVPPETVDGDKTPDEARQANQVQMQISQDAATIVALSYLGYDLVPSGAAIQTVVADSAADGLLEPRDVVVAMDGTTINGAQDLSDVVRGKSPGDELTITVERSGGAVETVTATLGTRPPPAEGEDPVPEEVQRAGFLGVSFVDNFAMDAPFDVAIDAGRIRGPSAGLAFTLGIIDVLTPGELTGGAKVAVTGTIDGAGRVGPIGGVRHKVIAARNAGYDLFLVPPDVFAEAVASADGLPVQCVETVDDALLALASVGGNALDVIPVDLQASPPSNPDRLSCADVGAASVDDTQLAQGDA